MTNQQQQTYSVGSGEHGDKSQQPMNYTPVAAQPGIPPMLKQVNRWEYIREYAEYWWVGARTYLIKTVVFLALGILVGMVFPLGSLLFFALAGRCHFKSFMFNFVVNNPGRSVVLVK